MELPKKTREELERIAFDFCQNNNLDMTKDVILELSELGFIVLKTKYVNPIDGMIMVNEYEEYIEGFPSNKIILFNQEVSTYKARFIIAHELSHYIIKKSRKHQKNIFIAARDHGVGDYSNNENEQAADFMAAALLLPREVLKRDISSKYGDSFSGEEISKEHIDKLISDQEFLKYIQEKYRVEMDCLKRRIREIFTVKEEVA